MTTPPATRRANRLAHERSPYLLQHAYNPVDWYPWGPEALAKAKQEDKPIFLSIGYSTCYWCHVMEQESFENDTIAQQINASFVPVKVDREERPDLDSVYMSAVQAMSGQGGWPMTVFLTPEGKPFWGGTYFPPEDRMGRPGLPTVLRSIAQAWQTRRADVLKSSDAVTQAIQATTQPSSTDEPDLALLQEAVGQFAVQYDAADGGFGPAPKFPRSHALSFLLRMWSRDRNANTLQMVTSTLDAMARGGMHDQLGGGFHRYATDAHWLVPHFEKMLYDQALLARTYLEAYQATGRQDYADVARDIFEYALRDLRDPGGAFYCAEDAGEVGKEGEFYVWTPQEVAQTLGEPEAALFGQVYGVTETGNFEHGRSILHLDKPLEDIAAAQGLSVGSLSTRLAAARAKLLASRSHRQRPHRDDKILADWNGLMIGALAYGGAVLDEPRYLQAAREAADFVLQRMRQDGRLLHRYRDGDARVTGFLDDYAFMTSGLLDLYEAGFEPKWLSEAAALARQMNEQFWDEQSGGFRFSGQRNEALIATSKELYDGALPSGNSMAAWALVRLSLLTQDAQLHQRAHAQLLTFSPALRQAAHAYPQFLIALDLWLGPSQEIVIAGDPNDEMARRMVQVVHRRFLPRTVRAFHPIGEDASKIEALIPFIKNQAPQNGRPAAYVCRNYVCSLPATDPSGLAAQLDGALP